MNVRFRPIVASRRRLLIVAEHGLAAIGGGVTILRNLVAGLAPDHRVVVASCTPSAGLPVIEEIRLDAPRSGLSDGGLTPFARARHLARVLPPGLVSQADLVISMDPHFATALRRRTPRRLVYLAPTCAPRADWADARSPLRFAQLASLERRMVLAADQVVVASAAQADDMGRCERLGAFRPIVIPPAFAHAGAMASDASKNARGDGPLVLVALARLDRGKNIAAAVHALRALGDAPVRLNIIGDGPERVRLEALVHAFGLDARVRFLGWRDDVVAQLGEGHVLLHPSGYESFGLAVFEAMRQGLVPVVAKGAAGALGDLVRDGETGLVADFAHPHAAAATLATLLVDDARRRALGARARMKADLLLTRDHVRALREVIETVDPRQMALPTELRSARGRRS
jgi:glycosyltransferase involved in cell wall biosynthesis